jgi:uncharacterized repeat protein (TIGR02543 family)
LLENKKIKREKKMKKLTSIVMSICLAIGIIGTAMYLSGCGKPITPTTYNIIFANSTVPPSWAVIDSVSNGFETHVYVQRGVGVAGWATNPNFRNMGFDATTNQNQVTQAQVSQIVVPRVQQINQMNPGSHFNIYVTDYNALAAYAIAYRAGLIDGQFTVKMVEDGAGTYGSFNTHYLAGKTAEQSFEFFQTEITRVNTEIAAIKADPSAAFEFQNFATPFAVATRGDAVFCIQQIGEIQTRFNAAGAPHATSKMRDAWGLTAQPDATVPKINFVSLTIDQGMNALTATQRASALDIFLGSSATATLTRTTLTDGTPVASTKLVIVGGRANSYVGYQYVQDITATSQIATYAQMQAAIANNTLFSEAEYNAIMTIVNASAVAEAGKVAAFNLLAEYKMFYVIARALVQDTMDIVFKGHPSEDARIRGEWQDANYNAGGAVFTQLAFDLVNNFYDNDTLGKTIGLMPAGNDMLFYAYIDGIDLVIGGQDSSTYTGYKTDIPVEFVLMSEGSIATHNTLGNIATRWNLDNIFAHDGGSTHILNGGAVRQLLNTTINGTNAAQWIAERSATYGDVGDGTAYAITRCGFLGLKVEGEVWGAPLTQDLVLDVNGGDGENVTLKIANGMRLVDVEALFAAVVPVKDGYTFTGWFTAAVDGTAVSLTPYTFVNNATTTAFATIFAQWEAIVS